MKHCFYNPDEYQQHSDLQYVFAHYLLKRAKLNNSDRVLDIGCGDGKVTADIAHQVKSGQVLGTDISEHMIHFANDQYGAKQKNLGFMVMEAENNIFKNQFDVVVSFCCLHWVKKQAQALKGISNALVDGGQAILMVPLRHEELYTAVESTINNLKWCDYFQNFHNPHVFFDKKQYSDLLFIAGLKSQSMEEEVMNYAFNSTSEMELFLKAWLPHVKCIPKYLHDEFMGDISAQFQKLVPPAEGKVNMPLRMLQVCAYKPQAQPAIIPSLFHHEFDHEIFFNPERDVVSSGYNPPIPVSPITDEDEECYYLGKKGYH